MSRGLGRVQRAVLADLQERRDAGEHPLTTRHLEGFSRSAVSRAYGELWKRGLILMGYPEIFRQGKGRLVALIE